MIIQIEHIEAVENLESITKVAGIDCVLVGPYDLSASMGKMGQIADPEVQKVVKQVKMRADEIKMPLGIFGATIDALEPFIQEGYTLLAIGIDTMLIAQTTKNIISNLRNKLRKLADNPA